MSELRGDSIFLVSDRRNSLSLARSQVESVQLSIAREVDLWRGVGLGAAGGALVGGLGILIASAALPSCDDRTGNGWQWCAAIGASDVVKVMGLFMVGGAVVGANKANNSPRDRWLPGRLGRDDNRVAAVRPRILLDVAGPAGLGSVRAGLSLAF
jgi:hypothetical protein